MGIIESTISLLFRRHAPISREQHEQKTRRILRDITDPAVSVGECLQPDPKDHATRQKTKPIQ